MVEGQIAESFYGELDKVAQVIETQQSAQKSPVEEEATQYWVCPNCGASKEATPGVEAPSCTCGAQMVLSASKQTPAGTAAGAA